MTLREIDRTPLGRGELEADIAFGPGADLVTVLAAADDDTIRGSVTSARRHGKGVVADLIAIRDRVSRAREVAALGVVPRGVGPGKGGGVRVLAAGPGR